MALAAFGSIQVMKPYQLQEPKKQAKLPATPLAPPLGVLAKL